jgi:undecaprenyl diphosphate synthase
MSAKASSPICVADTPIEARGPRHVAIIMDGNGRWASARGLTRTEGHRYGVDAVRRTVRCAGKRGIEYLTLFSFSSENWSRPKDEVSALMSLIKLFVKRDLADLDRNGVRIRVVGEREGLAPDILEILEKAESTTRSNTGLTLVVAFNYGARDEITRAARKLAGDVAAGRISAESIDSRAITANLDTHDIPDPDLIIRTSGEARLSNFLLWQAAYSELVFVAECWPDFDDRIFDAALDEFRRRERRFGGLAQEVVR